MVILRVKGRSCSSGSAPGAGESSLPEWGEMVGAHQNGRAREWGLCSLAVFEEVCCQEQLVCITL